MSDTNVRDVAFSFACPCTTPTLSTLSSLSGGFAQAAAQLFVEQFGSQLESASSGVAAAFRDWIDHDPDLAQSWAPWFGRLIDVVRCPNALHAVLISTQTLLHLQGTGFHRTWQVRFDEPVGLRVGTYTTPKVTECRCEAGSDATTIVGTLNGSSGFEVRLKTGSPLSQSTSTGRLHRLETAFGAIIFLPREVHNMIELAEEFPNVLETMRPDHIARFDAGMALLRDNAPLYAQWVERVLTEIVPLECVGDRLLSGGVATHFGQIHMTASTSRALIAEMLVHEASHQYFELLRRLDPLEYSPGTQTYYSPVVQRQRPMWAVLKAYHAFANVLCLHRTLRAAGIEEHELAVVAEDHIIRDLRILDHHLSCDGDLSPLGESLYSHLSDHISDHLRVGA